MGTLDAPVVLFLLHLILPRTQLFVRQVPSERFENGAEQEQASAGILAGELLEQSPETRRS